MNNESMKMLTRAAIKRLTLAAGIKTISILTYEELRYKILSIINTLTYRVMELAKFSGTKTIKADFVEFVSREIDGPAMTSELTPKACKQMKKRTKNMDIVDIIRFRQKNSTNCFMIPVATFDTLVRKTEKFGSFKYDEFRFSKEALTLMHFYVEHKIIDILKKAQSVTTHHGDRLTVQPKDVYFASQRM